MKGWIILDKPAGLTSFDLVKEVRKLSKIKSVGHCGTLDAPATGVLPIAVGKAACRCSNLIMDGSKEYRFTCIWGSETDTCDASGKILKSCEGFAPTQEQIEQVMKSFQGRIKQVPPIFSAIKKGGVPSYKRALKQEDFPMEAREVFIGSLKLIKHSLKESEFLLECAKGFYVRSLARDMGQALGGLAHVGSLRRERVGNFTLEDSVTLEHLKANDGENFESCLLSLESGLEGLESVVHIEIDHDQYKHFVRGNKIPLIASIPSMGESGSSGEAGSDIADNTSLLVYYGDSVVGFAMVEGNMLCPKKVFVY